MKNWVRKNEVFWEREREPELELEREPELEPELEREPELELEPELEPERKLAHPSLGKDTKEVSLKMPASTTTRLRFSGTRPRVPSHVRDHTVQIPLRVARNAARALDQIQNGARGGTKVGREMARILSERTYVPMWVPLKVAQYFPRHQHDRGVIERRGPGWVAWLLWGGDEGWSWGQSMQAVVERLEENWR